MKTNIYSLSEIVSADSANYFVPFADGAEFDVVGFYSDLKIFDIEGDELKKSESHEGEGYLVSWPHAETVLIAYPSSKTYEIRKTA